MSSFYDDASLVVIPSGYKTSKVYAEKPTDGSGDLTFTRTGDTATRVNSALIEKVRTNRVLYSNTFTNAAWVQFYSAVTAGEQDPFGGTSGTRFLTSSAGGYMYQNSVCVTGAEMTASVWVKSNTGSSQTFQITANAGSESSPSITATTSWQRVSWTFTSSSNGTILFGFNASSIIDVLIYGFQLETGVMTDYIATTTAAVSVGPTANTARLDYLGSTCPRLLLEPQRTNLVQFSESFDNAYWSKGGLNVSANNTTSPDGYINADKITENTTSLTTHYLNRGITLTAASHTLSVFAKAAERKWIFLIATTSADNGAFFDLENGAVGNVSAGYSAKIENYGNGWYKCSLTFTATAATWYMNYLIATANNTYNYSGTIGSGIFVWGAQLEAGAYATSYIPTLAASATRGADACSKTGISSLIGQTEGTLFLDFVYTNLDSNGLIPITIGEDSSNHAYVYIEGNERVNFDFIVAGSDVVSISTAAGFAVKGTRYKIAFAYKANNFAAYINGQLIGTDNSGAIAALSNFYLGYPYASGYSTPNTVNQALLFKTRLTNASLAELTTL